MDMRGKENTGAIRLAAKLLEKIKRSNDGKPEIADPMELLETMDDKKVLGGDHGLWELADYWQDLREIGILEGEFTGAVEINLKKLKEVIEEGDLGKRIREGLRTEPAELQA